MLPRGWRRTLLSGRSTCSTSRAPEHWYNIRADLPKPPPPMLHPGTMQPIGPEDLAPLFPMALIMQEVSEDAEIAIPEEVLDILQPLAADAPLPRPPAREGDRHALARIFYKYEGVSPAGSHKPNTAVAQAYYNKQEGRTRIATETGAGPVGKRAGVRLPADRPRVHGLHGARSRYEQKPYRALDDPRLGRRGRPQSRPTETNAGRAVLAEHPGLARAAWASRSPRRSRTPPTATTPPTRSAACSTTC